MKIAQVTSFFQPKYYKSNEYFIAKEMTRIGHKVVLFCPDKDPAWQKSCGATQSSPNFQQMDGFQVRRVPAEPILLGMPLMPSLYKNLQKECFDVIHTHEYFTFCSCQSALASKIHGYPLVLTQHNDQLPIPLGNRLAYLLGTATMGAFTFSQATRIIAISNDIKFHMSQLGFSKKKIAVIPNAVDTSFFSPNQKNILQSDFGISGPIALFVGRLVPEKGVSYLIQAFDKVVKKVLNAKLVIVGKGPMEEELKSLLKKLGTKNVFFIDRLENKMMPNVYAGCRVLVAPSLREPFGNVVLEAMASGKPVIGGYVGGIKDTIEHAETGYHVEPKDVNMLSLYLEKLLVDESLSVKLGENARKRILENYDSTVVAKRIERLYKDAILGKAS